MELAGINSEYLIDTLVDLLNIPSPTGMAELALAFVEKKLNSFAEVSCSRTRKGTLIIRWEGNRNDHPRAMTAHVDTLGAMVKEIKPNGRLKLTKLGGFAWNTVEGEGCTVFTHNGENIRGSILFDKASSHVYGAVTGETKREDANIEVRLDINTSSSEETAANGVMVGDFVAFDPRVEINNGYIRSRHLDDKACVATLLSAVKSMCEAGLKPAQTTYFLISSYEEVGHGAASGIPQAVEELVAVDMAAVGEGQNSDEQHASICVKDSGGPYDLTLSNHLRTLADQYQIPYKVDIYPYYGSDGGVFWRAGGDVRVALIGPGVDASHNYERTHLQALMATTQWVMAYLVG